MLTALILAAALAAEPIPDTAAALPTLAVLPFEGDMNSERRPAWYLEDTRKHIVSFTTYAFFKTHAFTILERAQIGSLLSEGKFQNGPMADNDNAIILGHQLGAKFLVLGSYSGNLKCIPQEPHEIPHNTYTGRLVVQLRLVNVETGAILDAEEIKVEGTNTPDSDIDNLLDKFSVKLDPVVAEMKAEAFH